MHLLQHLVDVDAVAFLSPALPLLVTGAHGFGFAGLLGAFAGNFGRHGCSLTSLLAGLVDRRMRARAGRNPFI